MSYGGYQQYGGNPYGNESGGYGSANPYGNDGGYNSNPYGGQPQQQHQQPPQDGYMAAPAPLTHEDSNYSQASQPVNNAVPQQLPPQPLSREDFLARIDGAKSRINELTSNISAIGTLHQRMISSPDGGSQAQLDSLVQQTQILNTGIKDEIKFLERDVSRDQTNNLKVTQIRNLQQLFRKQLQDYQRQESEYEKRYRDAIARQYRIVNPEATEEEVQEAANANWGNEGVFQTALKSNRSGQASSVLGAVRARHNDIVQIEKTIGELALLFQQLDEAVTYQEPMVQQVEQQTEQIKGDTENANVQLTKATISARRARKLKWWCFFIVLIIVAILAIALGVYFGGGHNKSNNNNGNNSNNGQ